MRGIVVLDLLKCSPELCNRQGVCANGDVTLLQTRDEWSASRFYQ